MMLAWCDEELSDHLRRVAHLAKRVAATLRLGQEDEEDAHLSGLLHDIGKADAGAQERLNKCIGAPGHELLSALMANRLLQQKLSRERRFKVAIAVLRHHQAMRSAEESLKDVRGWFRGAVRNPEELHEMLFEHFPDLELKDIESIWPSDLRKLESLVKDMQEEFKDLYANMTHTLRARLLSGVLMVADTYVAKTGRKGREGEMSRFGMEVTTFIESFLDQELNSGSY